MMTPRERILAVYNGQTPDRVPYMLDLSHYYLHKYQLPWDLCNGYPKPDTGLMDFTKQMGAAFYCPQQTHFWNVEYANDVKSSAVTNVVNGVPEIVWRFDTPIGSIERIRVWEPGSYSWAIKKWGVEDEKDLEVLAYAMSSRRYSAIPRNYEDWADYIGDSIITISVDRSCHRIKSLNSCSVLTERVLQMIPTVLTANNRYTEWTEGESLVEPENMQTILINHLRNRYEYERQPLRRPRYCIDAWSNALLRVRAEFDRIPELRAGESVTMTINCVTLMYASLHLDIQLHLPEGVTADRRFGRLYMDHQHENGDNWTVTLTATEDMKAMNRVIVEADVLGHPDPVLFAVPIIGK